MARRHVGTIHFFLNNLELPNKVCIFAPKIEEYVYEEVFRDGGSRHAGYGDADIV